MDFASTLPSLLLRPSSQLNTGGIAIIGRRYFIFGGVERLGAFFCTHVLATIPLGDWIYCASFMCLLGQLVVTTGSRITFYVFAGLCFYIVLLLSLRAGATLSRFLCVGVRPRILPVLFVF